VSDASPRPAPWRRARLAFAVAIPFVVFLLPGSESSASSAGPITLLPPLFAISLAFATARTVLPLFGGVWMGATMVAFRNGEGPASLLLGVKDTLVEYIFHTSVYAPASGEASSGSFQTFNLAVIGFVFVLVGMVSITIRAGGMAGIAERFVVLARSARATRLSAFGLGMVVFFDDYANTLIVGGAMRPLADRMRIAREKLAWIVDSTAAPVAGLSILSTWIAFEISQFAPHLNHPALGLTESAGYMIFIQSLPYRFYCILTLVFVFWVCLTSRDFGPMLTAEQRSFRTGAVLRPGAVPMSVHAGAESSPKPGIPLHAHVALLPIAVTLVAIVTLFLRHGEASHAQHLGVGLSIEHMREVLAGVSGVAEGADANTRLLFYGSLMGWMTAALLAIGHRLLSVREVFAATLSGSRAMATAVTVLLLAWAMSSVCGDLGTREYMASMAPFIPAPLLPAGLFFLACSVSFATGSSWSTMGILLPIVIGLAATVGAGSVLGAQGMVIVTIGAVLDGSIFGDHCSPISDTTILSSTAVGSDHMDHVKTQVPYALTVMSVAFLAGYLPAGSGFPVLFSLAIGAAALVSIVVLVGRRADHY